MQPAMMLCVPLPQMQPMLASTGPIPGSADDDAFEPKLDGWRALVYVDGTMAVRTRNSRDITETLAELLPLVEALGGRAAIVDGELVAKERRAHDLYRLGPRLAARPRLSLSRGQARRPVTFVAFDVAAPGVGGDHRMAVHRAAGAAGTAKPPRPGLVHGVVVIPDSEQSSSPRVFKLELEGLVAKRLDAPYRPGERSRSWVRAKAAHWRDVAAHPSTASDYQDNRRVRSAAMGREHGARKTVAPESGLSALGDGCLAASHWARSARREGEPERAERLRRPPAT